MSRARVTVETWDQYRNMREAIDRHPRIVTNAARRRSAARASSRCVDHPRRHRRLAPHRDGPADAEPLHRRAEVPLRREWASVQDMAAAAAMVVELVRVWGEPD